MLGGLAFIGSLLCGGWLVGQEASVNAKCRKANREYAIDMATHNYNEDLQWDLTRQMRSAYVDFDGNEFPNRALEYKLKGISNMGWMKEWQDDRINAVINKMKEMGYDYNPSWYPYSKF